MESTQASPLHPQISPGKQLKGLPAGRRRIPLAPNFIKKNWAGTDKWPVGKGFVAGEIGGEIYVWGGYQWQPSRGSPFLPTDVFYCFNPDSELWRKLPSSGDIPYASRCSAGVVCDGLLYIFGGYPDSGPRTNEIYSFSASSRAFQFLPVVGDRPSLRAGHEGWTYGGKLFFFGGALESNRIPPSKGIFTGPDQNAGCDNLLCQFDPQNNKWTKVKSSGPIPSPRSWFAVAQLDNQVFIHGGLAGVRIFNDLTMLDMTSSTWTKISGDGPSLYQHSLSPISPTRLFIIGGVGKSPSPRKETWIFDVKDNKWSQDEALSGSGLHGHRVVGAKRGNGISLIAFGGFDSNSSHPNCLSIFDFH